MTFEQAKIELEKIPEEIKERYQIGLFVDEESGECFIKFKHKDTFVASTISKLDIADDKTTIQISTPKVICRLFKRCEMLHITIL